jgi:hypothetical protein
MTIANVSTVFVSVKYFQASLMFVICYHPHIRAPSEATLRVSSFLTCKYLTPLKTPARDERSSLFCRGFGAKERDKIFITSTFEHSPFERVFHMVM